MLIYETSREIKTNISNPKTNEDFASSFKALFKRLGSKRHTTPKRAVCRVENRWKGSGLQHPVPFTNVVKNLHRIAHYFGKSFDIIGCPGTVHFAILTKVGFHQVVGTIDTHEGV